MPHVRISLAEGKSPVYLQALSDGIQQALVEALGVALTDRFQIIECLPACQFIVSNPLVGITHSDQAMLIHISLKSGRTIEIKKNLYRLLTANLVATLDVNPQDIIIVLVDLPPENWSFGHGQAQLIG
jgi:4-oxalocrotonate tautomerase